MTAARNTFIAREAELARLESGLAAVLAGRGQVVFVAGEAGAGKTSLAAEFMRRAQARHNDVLFAFADCNARTGTGDPYLPFREILALLAGDTAADIAQGNITEENASRLDRFRRLGQEAMLQAGGELIGMFIPGGGMLAWAAGKLTGIDRKVSGPASPMQVMEQYTKIICAASDHQPLVLVIDDLQWADAASIDLLFHLARRIEGSRVLLLGTYRPNDVALGRGGGRHPLESVMNEVRRYYGDVTLELAPGESDRRDFVARMLAADARVPDGALCERLLAHTRGNALFVVEVLRALEERGEVARGADGGWVQVGEIDWTRIPPRVEGVIEERIGRVDADLRAALTVASVEGEQFTAEVIARVRGVEPRMLVRRLSEDLDRRHGLVAGQGTRRAGAVRLSGFRFRHALFQRYLYGRLEAAERAYLHQDVGEVLEELLGEARGEHAVQLASHFVEAGDDDRSVEYLLLAGGHSVRLAAYAEALSHLRHGLDILERTPAGSGRDRRELRLLAAAGAPLLATRGFADDEVQRVHIRANELAAALGDDDELIPILFGLLTFHLGRGDVRAAHDIAQRRLALARRRGDPRFVLETLVSLGAVHFYMGDLAGACEHLEEALSLDTAQHDHAGTQHVFEPAVQCRRTLAFVYWLQDRPAAADALMHDALTLATERGVEYNIAGAHGFAAVLAQWRGAVDDAERHALEAVARAERGGFRFWIAFAGILRAWAGGRRALQTGDAATAATATAEMNRAIAAFTSAGTELWRPYFLYLLADVHAAAGDTPTALTALREARSSSGRNGDVFWDAELVRLEAALTVPSDSVEAQAGVREAIAIAQRQGAVALEKRAVQTRVAAEPHM